MSTSSSSPTPISYKNAPTRSVSVQGVHFAYRQLGPDNGVPLILLNHLSAVLDNWDPRVVDGLAARRRVITYDNRGVGVSGGSTPPITRLSPTTPTSPDHDALTCYNAPTMDWRGRP
ncbi:alpha/beta fold hydrolase [Streptomyces mutabilis]|uniref:alpha/beta fold hydrolase n=1 Tax=Streptomyces mutabilis TaxID=67332 RepID=UPI0034DFF98E